MAEFRFVATAVPGNINGDDERGNDHGHSKPAPATRPARIFKDQRYERSRISGRF